MIYTCQNLKQQREEFGNRGTKHVINFVDFFLHILTKDMATRPMTRASSSLVRQHIEKNRR